MNASDSSLVFDPIFPVGLIGVLGVGLLGLLGVLAWKTAQHAGRGRAVVLATLRGAGVLLLLVILLRPSREILEPPVTLDRQFLIAVDTSRSMAVAEDGRDSRYEQARDVVNNLDADNEEVRLFTFDAGSRERRGEALPEEPTGATTAFDRSMQDLLNALAAGQGAHGIILLTDGHDFELVNPAKTGLDARLRQAPIFPVAIGAEARPRDVSVRIASYEPYTYVKQKASVAAALRLIGVEHETLSVVLLREGKVVDSKRVDTETHRQVTVRFETREDEIGQVLYEVRVNPLADEDNLENNRAATFLNVIDKKITLLLIEGRPYWDTTFLQRALVQNEKLDLDAIIQYAPRKVRRIRKSDLEHELIVPERVEDFRPYNAVILGREIRPVLGPSGIEALGRYIDEGGVVIFLRGPALAEEGDDEGIQPLSWQAATAESYQLAIGRDGRSLAPFRTLADESAERGPPPALLAARAAGETKPLSAVLAIAEAPRGGSTPAIVHRRVGAGQVLSVGIEGLWRWAFNADADLENPLFDRFWDQMLLWLLAASDQGPGGETHVRLSSSNLELGEPLFFHLVGEAPEDVSVPITILHDNEEAGRVQLVRTPGQQPVAAEFVPAEEGHYQAEIRLPNGALQKANFIVSTQDLETTEVAVDLRYLERLAGASGGRVLRPEEISRLIEERSARADDLEPTRKREEIWDSPWFFYLTGLFFGLEWLLRRRWGLA